ncbi:Rieske 2Fe-2S domain-containing protein [bacterium]|nr:Rieske 2Fe-2S domain-containing protein [bacterium]
MSETTFTTDPSKDNRIGFFKRLLGKCLTEVPRNDECWSFADGNLTIDLGKAGELARPGQALRFEAETLPHRVLVVHGDDGEYHAFKNECTHGKRQLDPVPGAGTVQCCSLGKSTFEYSGEFVRGSAKDNLTVYPVTVAEKTLTVQLG